MTATGVSEATGRKGRCVTRSGGSLNYPFNGIEVSQLEAATVVVVNTASLAMPPGLGSEVTVAFPYASGSKYFDWHFYFVCPVLKRANNESKRLSGRSRPYGEHK